MKYIPKGRTVWCPFDETWSAFYQLLRERGYPVVRSSLAEGQYFFSYEPEAWDVVVSNPPFSKKDEVLERLNELGKPFALLLPLATLQGQRRFRCLKQGIEILAFDKCVTYHRKMDFYGWSASCSFASVYFCRSLLPEKLILEELTQYERPLRRSD